MIEQGAYILIAAGAFIFIISFLGYCGAIKESRVLLTAFDEIDQKTLCPRDKNFSGMSNQWLSER